MSIRLTLVVGAVLLSCQAFAQDIPSRTDLLNRLVSTPQPGQTPRGTFSIPADIAETWIGTANEEAWSRITQQQPAILDLPAVLEQPNLRRDELKGFVDAYAIYDSNGDLISIEIGNFEQFPSSITDQMRRRGPSRGQSVPLLTAVDGILTSSEEFVSFVIAGLKRALATALCWTKPTEVAISIGVSFPVNAEINLTYDAADLCGSST